MLTVTATVGAAGCSFGDDEPATVTVPRSNTSTTTIDDSVPPDSVGPSPDAEPLPVAWIAQVGGPGDDRLLRWDRTAAELDRVVRVGGATTTVDGRRLKVLSAALDAVPDSVAVPTASGVLHLVEVQPEGKRPMSAADWLRGLRLTDPPALGT